jgi:hypothetical protein
VLDNICFLFTIFIVNFVMTAEYVSSLESLIDERATNKVSLVV